MARAWARSAGPDEADEAARAFGLAPPPRAQEEVEVWPECVESVRLFGSLATQWRIEPMSGQVLGLDYAAAAAAMDMLGIADRRQAFEDLRAMEAAALESFRSGARG